MRRFFLIVFAAMLALSMVVTSFAESSENSMWKMGQYVDDFGDPTGDSFLHTEIDGTFSNTAATDAALFVKIRYDLNADSIAIELLEYKEKSAVYYANSVITLKFKVDGEIYTHSLSSSNAPGNIIAVNDSSQNWADVRSSMSASEQLYTIQKARTFEKSAFQQIRQFLLDGIDVRCVLQIDSSKYKFTIPASGLAEALFEDKYNAAVACMNNGEYEQAYEMFSAIGEYKGSKEKAMECQQKTYGRAVAAIEDLQKAQGIPLREAIAIVEADSSFDESELNNAFMEKLRTYAKCEGSFYHIGFQEKKYEMLITFVLEQGAVTATAVYENAPPAFTDISVELLLNDPNGYLVQMYASRIDWPDQRWDIKVKEDEAVAKLASWWTDVCVRLDNN